MNLSLEYALRGIVLHEVGEVVGGDEIIDGDDLVTLFEEALFDDGTEDEAADAAEPIDGDIWHDKWSWDDCAGGRAETMIVGKVPLLRQWQSVPGVIQRCDGREDLIHGLLVRESRGIGEQVARLTVNGEPGLQKGIEGRAGILDFQQGSLAIPRRPLKENFGIRVKPDNGSQGSQDRSVFGFEDRSPAGGQHDSGLTGETGKFLRLPPAEPLLAFTGEDLGDGTPGSGGDKIVAVEKSATGPRCQPAADAALAAPHEADQDDVGNHKAILMRGRGVWKPRRLAG